MKSRTMGMDLLVAATAMSCMTAPVPPTESDAAADGTQVVAEVPEADTGVPDSDVLRDAEADCNAWCGEAECGDDGCGGTCGTCLDGQTCNPLKRRCIAECQRDCGRKVCGDDGCGGTCGSCPSGGVCEAGQCLPEPRDVIEPSDHGPAVDLMPLDRQFVDTAGVDVCVSDCGTECIGVTPATNLQGACFQYRDGLCIRYVECGALASIDECISMFTENSGDCDFAPADPLDASRQASLKECLCELPMADCSALSENGPEVAIPACGRF